ncbi:olfactory receptor class A-like protein 4 [Rhinatrema bivittatum]|uniref:olfactory receptor class A-like protein 4 n=1 Tax=Rhinatrema bivittatum TaxID=194408 RepID=UPI001126CDAE|nr:olfactory receptor class A-like protein 4 [Rhinatrema bivittatum]
MPEENWVQSAFYGALVFLGILGNILVLLSVVCTAVENHTIPASDLILANLSTINLLLSVFRNAFLFTAEAGLRVLLSAGWCKAFMFLWLLLRTMCVWATFSLSFFHFLTIRKQRLQMTRSSKGAWSIAKAITAVWILNFLYSTPALVYSNHGASNTNFTVMLVSSTTRPLLGCVWSFPSQHSALLYVTTSLIIHEVIPVILMIGTNSCTLYILSKHIRVTGAESMLGRVAAERRAAKVILFLVLLFIACWGTNVLAVNYYNFTRGSSMTFLLQVANFGASLFMAFSPIVLIAGHSKLRRRLQKMIFCC